MASPTASSSRLRASPGRHTTIRIFAMAGNWHMAAAPINRVFRAVAEAGATSVTPLVLHLRPGAREWLTAWPGAHRPRPAERYERLYEGGSYAPARYRRRIARQVHELAAEFGIGPTRRSAARRTPVPERPAEAAPAGPVRLGPL